MHLIVAKHGCLVEVQLRTLTQHAWAEMIESADRSRMFGRSSLKTSEAPADVLEYYRLGAELLESQERGQPSKSATLTAFRQLNRKIQREYREERGG